MADPVVPLTLKAAVGRALRESPAIKQGCDGVIGSRYRLDIAEGDLGFRLNTQSGSGLGTDTQTSQATTIRLAKKFEHGTDVELSAGNTSTDTGFYRSFTGVTLSQSVLHGFDPLTHTAHIVDASRKIVTSERQLVRTRDQALLDVIAAYYQVIEQKLGLGIAVRASERAREILKATQGKLERGMATKNDLFRAQSQASSAESTQLDAEESFQSAKDSLRIAVGMDLTEPFDTRDEIDSVKLAAGEEDLVSEGLQKRVDLQEAADQVTDAERNLEIAKTNLIPDLRVGVNYSLVGTGDSFGASTGLNQSSFRVIISSDVALDRDAAKAQYGEAALEVEAKKRALDELQKKDTQEIRQAIRHLSTVRRRFALQENDLASARASLDLATLRFDRGYANNTEVLQAQEALTQSQRAEVDLRIEQTLAALKLRSATGSLDGYLEELLGEPLPAQPCP